MLKIEILSLVVFLIGEICCRFGDKIDALVKNDPKWPNVAQIWPQMSQNGPRWSKMTQNEREVRSLNPQAVQSAVEIRLLTLLWESGRSTSGETCQLDDIPRHSSTPAIISMIRVDQVKHHQGKASPPVGSGCQVSLQILEVKTK